MSSRSKGSRRRRQSRTTNTAGLQERVVSLNAPPRRLIVTAVLRVDGLAMEATAHLYWAVCALDPFAADVDEQELVAHFVRYAASVEVAAWDVIDQVRALPQARLSQVEAGRPDKDRPDLVLATGELTDRAWRRRAA